MHSWITCCRVSMLPENYWSVFTVPAVTGKMSLLSFAVSRQPLLLKQLCDVSCDKILQCDWTALYSAVGHGLYTQFTRPFSLLRKWVWLARLSCKLAVQGTSKVQAQVYLAIDTCAGLVRGHLSKQDTSRAWSILRFSLWTKCCCGSVFRVCLNWNTNTLHIHCTHTRWLPLSPGN